MTASRRKSKSKKAMNLTNPKKFIYTLKMKPDASDESDFTMEEDNKKAAIKVLGVTFTGLSPTVSFAALAVCHIGCAMTFAVLQEKAFTVPGFKKFKQLLTVETAMVFCACAYVERVLTGDTKRQTSIKLYAILSVLTTSGMYFTNASLAYLSYPARIIFKSGKPVPTMLVEWGYVGKKFSALDVTSVIVLTAGIICFAQGELGGNHSQASETMGFVLILTGVLFDAMTANFEKKNIFSECSASHAEVMFFSNIFASVLAFLAFTQDENFYESGAFIRENPEILWYIGMSAFGGYFAVSFILLLIKHFGPTGAECVKGFRKVLSIAASYILFPNPDKLLNSSHFMGVGLLTLSIGVTALSKARRAQQQHKHKYTPVPSS